MANKTSMLSRCGAEVVASGSRKIHSSLWGQFLVGSILALGELIFKERFPSHFGQNLYTKVLFERFLFIVRYIITLNILKLCHFLYNSSNNEIIYNVNVKRHKISLL